MAETPVTACSLPGLALHPHHTDGWRPKEMALSGAEFLHLSKYFPERDEIFLLVLFPAHLIPHKNYLSPLTTSVPSGVFLALIENELYIKSLGFKFSIALKLHLKWDFPVFISQRFKFVRHN